MHLTAATRQSVAGQQSRSHRVVQLQLPSLLPIQVPLAIASALWFVPEDGSKERRCLAEQDVFLRVIDWSNIAEAITINLTQITGNDPRSLLLGAVARDDHLATGAARDLNRQIPDL